MSDKYGATIGTPAEPGYWRSMVIGVVAGALVGVGFASAQSDGLLFGGLLGGLVVFSYHLGRRSAKDEA